MRAVAFTLLAVLLAGMLPAGAAEGPDLEVVLHVPDRVVAGETANLTVEVQNVGDAAASGYAVTVRVDGRQIARITGDALDGGEQRLHTAAWRPGAGGEHAVAAAVAADGGDADPANDRFELQVRVEGDGRAPRLVLDDWERVGEAPAEAGDPLAYRVTVANRGNATARDVVLEVDVDGTRVDTLRVAEVPAGEARAAQGNWTPPERGVYDLGVRFVEPALTGIDAERAFRVTVTDPQPQDDPGDETPPEEPPEQPPEDPGDDGDRPPADRTPQAVLVLGTLEVEPPADGSRFGFVLPLHNQGNATARDVRVVFRVDGETVGSVPVAPIPPSGRYAATLRTWSGEVPGPHEVTASVDAPEGVLLVTPSADAMRADVLVPAPPDDVRGAPAVGGLMAVGAAVSARLLRRVR